MQKMAGIILGIALLSFCQNVYSADNNRYVIQEPKSDTMELVSFVPQKINFPFEIKYPAKWYVREETVGMPSLFLTREPIRTDTDRYTVGASLLYNIAFFSSREPSNSALGQTADFVIKIKDWDESKKQFIEGLKEGGNTIISQSDVTISGQPALRVEYKSKTLHAITFYIRVGVHLLAVTFEAPPNEYGQYKDVFDKILSSIFFTR